MEEKKRIDLKYPIEVKKENETKTYSYVEIGRMKNKHLKVLPKDFFSASKDGNIPPAILPELIASITGIPLEVADEMDLEDTMKISESLESFFGVAQTKTGQN